jgi:hypothetical protein
MFCCDSNIIFPNELVMLIMFNYSLDFSSWEKFVMSFCFNNKDRLSLCHFIQHLLWGNINVAHVFVLGYFIETNLIFYHIVGIRSGFNKILK